jgi:hypothetical protein
VAPVTPRFAGTSLPAFIHVKPWNSAKPLELIRCSFKLRDGDMVFPVLKIALDPHRQTIPEPFDNIWQRIFHITFLASESPIINPVAALCRITTLACVKKRKNFLMNLKCKKVYILPVITECKKNGLF